MSNKKGKKEKIYNWNKEYPDLEGCKEAVKGIDEKFSINAVNDPSSFSIPLLFSQASDLSPPKQSSYNSGSGNEIFGKGRSISLGAIKKKTNKNLPKYLKLIISDIFYSPKRKSYCQNLIKIHPEISFCISVEIPR